MAERIVPIVCAMIMGGLGYILASAVVTARYRGAAV